MIVNERHFERLSALLDEAVASGARRLTDDMRDDDDLFLATTLLEDMPKDSGIGKSHGYHGFLAFSHERSVVTNRIGIVDRLFPPYTPSVERMAVWT